MVAPLFDIFYLMLLTQFRPFSIPPLPSALLMTFSMNSGVEFDKLFLDFWKLGGLIGSGWMVGVWFWEKKGGGERLYLDR